MRFATVPLGELPGASALFATYVGSFECAARFYRHDPFSIEGWKSAARQALASELPRQPLVEALAPVNPDPGALEQLADPRTVAVVTGQQAGLFGGPCYTLYKALTAVQAARTLTEAGQPAVPVFWVASEDHDLAEVQHAHVFDTRVRPLRIESGVAEGHGHPAGAVPIPQPPIDELAAALDGFMHAEEALELVRAAYPPGRTFSQAFRDLLATLLRPYGVVFVDPLLPGLRRLAAPLLEKAWQQRDALGQALLERRRELESAGFHAQVEIQDGTGLFFVLDHGVRRRAAHTGPPSDPALLSPNALLRPVMQDWLLPTAVYVGGPAEIAYFAQAEVLYGPLLGRMPAILPRAAFTLIDSCTRKLMERCQVTLLDCLEGEEALLQRIAARLAPSHLEEAFDNAERTVAASVDGLRSQVAAFDPTLGEAMGRSRARMLYQLQKMRRKTQRAALRRQAETDGQARHAFRLVSPHRRLQERYYSFVPFLARFGFGMVDSILAGIDPVRPAHQVLSL